MMISNIEKILIASGFHITELQAIEPIKLYTKDNNEGLINSAFVVTDITNVEVNDVLVDLQSNIYHCLETLGSLGSLEKNTTLILLYEHSSALRDKTLKYVAEIEEDQYFFKKQVLFYTSEEEQFLAAAVSSESPISALEKILYDQSAFAKYSDGNCDGKYSIISRTFAKLPFLTVQRAAQSRPNLSEAIEVELEKIRLSDLRDKLLGIGSDQTKFEKWIEEMIEAVQ